MALIGARVADLGSDMLGMITLDPRGWVVLALLPLGFALLATLSARTAVLRALKGVL